MEPVTLIGYIRSQLHTPGGSFVREWGGLSQKDKDDLLAYAREEMGVLGIPVKA